MGEDFKVAAARPGRIRASDWLNLIVLPHAFTTKNVLIHAFVQYEYLQYALALHSPHAFTLIGYGKGMSGYRESMRAVHAFSGMC